ncbi:MAG: hypothetical protein PHY16_07810 [Methylobacter sp.]|nr:hypothetical protein [Methylobacter sp.]
MKTRYLTAIILALGAGIAQADESPLYGVYPDRGVCFVVDAPGTYPVIMPSSYDPVEFTVAEAFTDLFNAKGTAYIFPTLDTHNERVMLITGRYDLCLAVAETYALEVVERENNEPALVKLKHRLVAFYRYLGLF